MPGVAGLAYIAAVADDRQVDEARAHL